MFSARFSFVYRWETDYSYSERIAVYVTRARGHSRQVKMDVLDKYDQIALDLNLDIQVQNTAWENYEKTRKVFCLEVCLPLLPIHSCVLCVDTPSGCNFAISLSQKFRAQFPE